MGAPVRRALLVQDALQPQPQRPFPVGRFQPDQGEVAAAATTPGPAIPAVSGIRCAVNPSPKSVVREIRTLRSVGAGGG